MRLPHPEQIDPHIMAELQRNERHAAAAHLYIHAERLGHGHGALFCTVRQLSRGFLGHRLTTNELIERAQQALSPLLSLGLMPLVTAIPWKSSRRMERPKGYRPGPDPFGIKAAIANGVPSPSSPEREAPAA